MGISYWLNFSIFDILENKSIFVFTWIFIFFISVSFTMNQSTLFLPRLINESKQVVHYCSESRILFENRKKVKISTNRNKRIQRSQKRGQQFGTRLTGYNESQKTVQNEYKSYYEKLYASYQETFQDCKAKNNLASLLYEFDVESLEKDHYRDVCMWLVPAIMAFNDVTFLEDSKIDFLNILCKECRPIIQSEEAFCFRGCGLPYNDAFELLKLITLYNLMSLAGYHDFVNNLKARHPLIKFDTLNYIEIITDFDFIAEKKFEILEQKTLMNFYPYPLHLHMSESLQLKQQKIISRVGWTQELNKIRLLWLYPKYKQIMRDFDSDPVKQEWFCEFFNEYYKKRVLDSFIESLYFVLKPFIVLFKYFDSCVDKILLKIDFDENYDDANDDVYYNDE